MNCPKTIEDSPNTLWMGKGYKYTNPVEVTNNQWQCQLIVAADQFAHAKNWITQLEIALRLGADCEAQLKSWRKKANTIRQDIHKMVVTMEPINEYWTIPE